MHVDDVLKHNYTYNTYLYIFTYFHDKTTRKRSAFQDESLQGSILVLQLFMFLMGIEQTTSEFVYMSNMDNTVYITVMEVSKCPRLSCKGVINIVFTVLHLCLARLDPIMTFGNK